LQKGNDVDKDVSENDYYREKPSIIYDDEEESYPHKTVTSEGEGDELSSSIEEIPVPKRRRRSRSRRQKQTGSAVSRSSKRSISHRSELSKKSSRSQQVKKN
jgi:hypothetical protein